MISVAAAAIDKPWNRSMRDEPDRLGARTPGDPPWRVRGPLELILGCSFVIALAAFLVWYFVLAGEPPLVTFGGGPVER